MDKKIKDINLKEGSINFWIPKKTIDFNDSKIYKLFSFSSSKGGILIVKDSDKKIKAIYVKVGEGKLEKSKDISSLSEEDRHMVTLTWKDGRINFYINGELTD